MPAYDYRCPVCESVFEQRHSILNPPESVPCEACGADGAKRLMGTGGAVNAHPCTSQYGFPSTRLPRWMPGEKHDEHGRVIVKDRQHYERLAKSRGFEIES
jgi:putative FmdB family regulatory protein